MSSKIVPNSSSEKGNTSTSRVKQVSPSNGWCFTLNNWTEQEYSSIVPILKSGKYFYIVGKEVGESKTPHLQGFFRLKDKKKKFRPVGVLNNKRIHFQRAKGSDESQFYCAKDGDFITNMEKFREYQYKMKNPLKAWMVDLENIMNKHDVNEDRKIYWYWSEAGATGKTSFQKYFYQKNKEDTLPLSGKGADMKNAVLSFSECKGYTPKYIMVNIPRSVDTKFISYGTIELVKDMFFYSGKYEGGVVFGDEPFIVFFANTPPDEDCFSSDRWVIRNVDEKKNNLENIKNKLEIMKNSWEEDF